MARRIQILVAALVGCTVLSTTNARAQNGNWFNNGGQYGQLDQINWQTQQGIYTERPGAAIVGGLLQGIGGGLSAQSPKDNAVAAGILNGLGSGFTIASNPTVWSQGNVQRRQQGYYNNWQNSGQFNPSPFGGIYSARPQVGGRPQMGGPILLRPW